VWADAYGVDQSNDPGKDPLCLIPDGTALGGVDDHVCEGHFSRFPCDGCGSPLGGNRYCYEADDSKVPAPRSRFRSYMQGMREFRQDVTTSQPSYRNYDAYDRGRDRMHSLTLRVFDDDYSPTPGSRLIGSLVVVSTILVVLGYVGWVESR
jgi:hypothetical protein